MPCYWGTLSAFSRKARQSTRHNFRNTLQLNAEHYLCGGRGEEEKEPIYHYILAAAAPKMECYEAD